jgi:sulfonate transport system substrate-binding protein
VTVSAANAEILKKNPAAFQILLKVEQDLAAVAHEHPEQFQNLFTDQGPTATSGERLRIAIEEMRVAPVQRVPTDADKVRIENVAKLFFENKSIDRNISVDEVVFDIDAAAKAKVEK